MATKNSAQEALDEMAITRTVVADALAARCVNLAVEHASEKAVLIARIEELTKQLEEEKAKHA